MIKFYFDIEAGAFKGYFRDTYNAWKENSDDPQNVSWPFTGTKWVLLYNSEGGTNRDFKSFCTALEDSGTEVWRNGMFDAANLKGALIGIIFRREEQEYMGERKWRTVPWGFRSVKAIEEGTFKVPEDKALPPVEDIGDSFSQLDVDLPF